MIKFFRKIRQKLLFQSPPSGTGREGKFSRYLLYAIGEIILVVIGILFALQLNIWKTEADENVKVMKYMDGLNSDLRQDYERMDSLFAFYSKKTNSMQLLLKSSNQNIELSNEELGERFNSVLEYRKFSNKKSNYLSLISEGFINKVNNKDLVNEIIKYYESPYLTWSTEIYENILESIDFNQSEFYNSQDGLIHLNLNNSIPNWEITNTKFQTNYKELVRSKWAINILTRILKQSNFIFINLDSYKKINDDLRKEIENYKNSN
jgi:hypothetical protein